MGEAKKIRRKSDTKKKRTGTNSYVGKYEHVFNKKWSNDEIKALADELLEWIESQNTNLWFKDFFVQKRISRQRCSEFEKKSPYFAKVIELCRDIQEGRLFKMGASKQVNPAMPILALKNNHGWRDKHDIKTQNQNYNIDLKKFTDEQLSVLEKIVKKGQDPKPFLLSTGINVEFN